VQFTGQDALQRNDAVSTLHNLSAHPIDAAGFRALKEEIVFTDAAIAAAAVVSAMLAKAVGRMVAADTPVTHLAGAAKGSIGKRAPRFLRYAWEARLARIAGTLHVRRDALAGDYA